jgi:hypothetical protein
VAWINHILKTDFSLERRFQLWKSAEGFALSRLDRWDKPLSMENLMDIIPYGMKIAAGGTELTDLLYIIHGTDSLDTDRIMAGSYPADVLQCKRALMEYFDTHPEENAEERIWALVKRERKEREAGSNAEMRAIAKSSLFLPARVLIYLTEELKNRDFWHRWKELKDSVYHDEQTKTYATEERINARRCAAQRPIPKIFTSDFLRQDSRILFYDTPEELKGKPNYYISDDDRMYWWDGTDEVRISDETDTWIKELAQRHKQIAETLVDQEPDSPLDFLRTMIVLLDKIRVYYRRIYAFQSMFYEFINCSGEKEYRAAIALLRELYEENKEDGKIIETIRGSWDFASRNVTHNIARIRLKRYLSVMANKELRKLYFGF